VRLFVRFYPYQVEKYYRNILTATPLDRFLQGVVGRDILHGMKQDARIDLLTELTGKTPDTLDPHLLHGTFARPTLPSPKILECLVEHHHSGAAAPAPVPSPGPTRAASTKRGIVVWHPTSLYKTGLDASILLVA
jgi:hypothetical protein